MHSFTPSLSFLLFIFLLPLQFPFGFFTSSASASLAFAADLRPASNLVGRHSGPSHRRRSAELGRPLNARSELMLYPGRRAAGASFTFFKTGLGACGNFNVPSDFIVALNMQQFDAANHCGATITITINGKSAQATIADRCVECGYNNLDFTTGLYAHFDPSMFGVLHGDWEYGSGAPAQPKPTPKPKPIITTTTKTTSRTTTTSSTKTPTSTSTTKTSTKASSTSSVASTTASTPSATSTSVPDVFAGNIEGSFEAFLSMGNIIMGALGSSSD